MGLVLLSNLYFRSEFLPGNRSCEVTHFERGVAPNHHDIRDFLQLWLHVRPDPSLVLVQGGEEGLVLALVESENGRAD